MVNDASFKQICYSLEMSGLDCILVLVLNTEHKLSYILADLFKMCMKESCFPDFWKVSFVIAMFKNIEKGSAVQL